MAEQERKRITEKTTDTKTKWQRGFFWKFFLSCQIHGLTFQPCKDVDYPMESCEFKKENRQT